MLCSILCTLVILLLLSSAFFAGVLSLFPFPPLSACRIGLPPVPRHGAADAHRPGTSPEANSYPFDDAVHDHGALLFSPAPPVFLPRQSEPRTSCRVRRLAWSGNNGVRTGGNLSSSRSLFLLSFSPVRMLLSFGSPSECPIPHIAWPQSQRPTWRTTRRDHRRNGRTFNPHGRTPKIPENHDGVKDEKLKASDQLGWISRMNSIRHRVEEIVLDELVFN